MFFSLFYDTIFEKIQDIILKCSQKLTKIGQCLVDFVRVFDKLWMDVRCNVSYFWRNCQTVKRLTTLGINLICWCLFWWFLINVPHISMWIWTLSFSVEIEKHGSKVQVIAEHPIFPTARNTKTKQHFQSNFPRQGLKHRKIKETTDQQNNGSTKQDQATCPCQLSSFRPGGVRACDE